MQNCKNATLLLGGGGKLESKIIYIDGSVSQTQD